MAWGYFCKVIHGTAPGAQIMGAAMFLHHTRPREFSMHLVDATIIKEWVVSGIVLVWFRGNCGGCGAITHLEILPLPCFATFGCRRTYGNEFWSPKAGKQCLLSETHHKKHACHCWGPIILP